MVINIQDVTMALKCPVCVIRFVGAIRCIEKHALLPGEVDGEACMTNHPCRHSH